jgi:transcription-repair coupling factor (superfamily II helicase)
VILPLVRELFADVERNLAFARAASPIKSHAGRIRLSGLTPTAKLLHVALVYRAAGRPILYLVANNKAAEEALPILRAFAELTGAADPASVLHLPAYDVLPFENLSPHPEIQEQRAHALWSMATGAANIVVTPIKAAAMCMRTAEYYAGLARTLRRSETMEPESLVEHLNIVGYTKAEVVEMPGEYALRGGILDVFPPEADRPVRIEFFGDEIESIRSFDAGTQRSLAARDEVTLLPLSENPVSAEILAAIHTRLSGKRVQGPREIVENTMSELGVGVFPGWEFYAPVAGAQATLFDLLPRAAVIYDEEALVREEFERWWDQVEAVHERSGIGNLVRPTDLYIWPAQLAAKIDALPGGSLEHLGVASGDGGASEIQIQSQPTRRFHGALPEAIEDAKKLAAEGHRVVFAAGNTGDLERMGEVFSEYGLPYRLGTRGKSAGDVSDESYLVGDLSVATLVKAFVPEGVALPESQLVIFGTRDLFDDSDLVATHAPRQKSKSGTFLSDLRDLAVGDYVVHVEHGIGQYLGLKEITQDEATAEFMVLEYAEGAKLYVPLTRLDLVQKYRSAEGARPALAHLGTQQWNKTKAHVKKAMKDMAEELVKLYAARRMAHGHSYPPDSQWQKEFEDAFEHNETDDQSQAIDDVKADMQSTQPMDRLLCGDVGYGKTEVAMRAAFKAASDNKQVVVLAPTTVLAFQHFETFKQRFSAFPLTIEMLSRFRSPKQQKEIIEKVEAGKVDILIGTHRVLSKDIKFQDLGLVVVDEEQRFGVRHKERLKTLRKEVDVLTLSATPIPRTLHMAVVGLRDMSVIETPPRDRIAIQTVVANFDEKLIRSAIEHELERSGQAYFVHNRVESIYEIAAKIQELVPKARVIVGHGQMQESELEKVMLKFIRHEADVLVATTIIENGLDIPLCNTIIVNRADRHGLSELYQLRGRVGRSNRRAYAYLLIPAETELTPIARRRLAALKEFSDLGAGFKIAALDLELRGAGNLLGGEQSGHIDAVGFELYTSMLDRTVRELKGEELPREIDTQLNLGLNIKIPDEYIGEENQRLRMYKRIAGVSDERQLGEVAAELADRYGPTPMPVQSLLDYASVKLLCQRAGVAGIDRRRDQISIRFTPDASIDPGKLAQFVAAQKGAQFTPAGVLKFSLSNLKAEDVLARLKHVLDLLGVEAVRVV